jgi:hypothetical protein
MRPGAQDKVCIKFSRCPRGKTYASFVCAIIKYMSPTVVIDFLCRAVRSLPSTSSNGALLHFLLVKNHEFDAGQLKSK